MSNYSNVQQTDYVPQLGLAGSGSTYMDCGMPIKLTGLILYFTADVAGSPKLELQRRARPNVGTPGATGLLVLGTIDFTGKPLPKAGDTVHFDFNNIDEVGTVGNRGDRFALIMDTPGSGGNCIVGWNGYPFDNTRNVHVYGEVPRGKSSPYGRVVDGAKFVEAS
tara:strand:+ start:702 stop:1196 length:495 start_codon:yes stop_codon:yes gene_type:complete